MYNSLLRSLRFICCVAGWGGQELTWWISWAHIVSPGHMAVEQFELLTIVQSAYGEYFWPRSLTSCNWVMVVPFQAIWQQVFEVCPVRMALLWTIVCHGFFSRVHTQVTLNVRKHRRSNLQPRGPLPCFPQGFWLHPICNCLPISSTWPSILVVIILASEMSDDFWESGWWYCLLICLSGDQKLYK